MAITINVTNDNPILLGEMACSQPVSSLAIPSQPAAIDFCHCDYECEYEELALAKVGGDDYQNDTAHFLKQLSDSTSTLLVEMFKNGVQVATIVDNTYGQWFPIGSSDVNEDQSGFIAEWEKIFPAFGGGQYHFKFTQINFAREVVTESQKYKLRGYSDLIADGTTRIQTFQDGFIIRGLDYSGLNWKQSFRVPGRFGRVTPDLEQDTYFTTDYVKEQIQDQVILKYELECTMIPAIVSNQLILDNLLANKYVMNDYNVFQGAGILRDVVVYPDGIDEAKYFDRSQKGIFKFSFSDKKQDILKRNVK